MKKWIIIILLMMLIPTALAQICGDIVNINANCTLISPVLNCTPNYTVYSTSGDVLEDGVMATLNATAGIYYFQWNLNESGIIDVCDYTREVQVGGGNMSDLIAIVLGAIAFLWKGNAYLGLVVGGALMANTIVSVSIGGVLPLFLKRMKLDPALVASPMLTTVTDMCGFFFVLGFATLLLSKLA